MLSVSFTLSTKTIHPIAARLLTMLVFCCATVSGNFVNKAHAQGAISPGAVQPQLERPRDIPDIDDEDVINVPAVRERPLDSLQGPVIDVTAFQLNFYVDGDEYHDQREQQLIDQGREMLEQLRSEKNGRFAITDLQAAANQVSQLYRQAGYLLATAFVPEQEVDDGIVVIDVLVGAVGEVSVQENSLYSADTILKRAGDVNGSKLEQQTMETVLLRVDDLPGLDAYGLFRPGSELGAADLEIRVNEVEPFDFLVIADNYGTESTGSTRLIGSANWNNPTGHGDRLNLTVLQSFDPSDSTYGSIGYQLPVSNQVTLGTYYSTNDYQIAQQFAELDYDGDTRIFGIDAETSVVRSREYNLYNRFGLEMKKAELSFAGTDFEDDLTVVFLEFAYDKIDSYLGGGFNQGSVKFSMGLQDFLGSMDNQGDGNALRQGAGGDFTKVALDYSRYQNLFANQSLYFRLQGQYSDDILTSLEQFSMGGPNSVRAYTVSQFIRDSGYFSSLAWVFNAPGFANSTAFGDYSWGDVFSISVFVDYAKGKLNQTSFGEDTYVELSGAGISLELNVPDNFYVRLDAATPLGSLDASDDDNPQYWLSAGIQF